MDGFEILSAETIRAGDATDAYFDRTVEALDHAGRNPHVVAEVCADQFPTGRFECLAGVRDAATLFEGYPVDVDALREGQCFDGGPVLRIEGTYREFARLETALLGLLSQASAFATRALRARRAGPDVTLLSFGSRHLHPAIATVLERSALVGGLDGISNVAAGEHLGVAAGGTMPHSLVICFGRGEQEAAWRAFHESAPPEAPRIALCDTYADEVEEAIRAAETLGAALDGVRLDTTGSRRGDFAHIVREVRWELDARGYDDVDVFLSGGMTATAIDRLRHHADGFGVGSFITNADPLDFALDVVERDGEPAAKRGKLSGKKQVYRTDDGGHYIARADRPRPSDGEALLRPLLRDGEIVRDFDLDAAAERATADAERVAFEWERTSECGPPLPAP
jgi:nicotinate phosphoribosyltransferase